MTPYEKYNQALVAAWRRYERAVGEESERHEAAAKVIWATLLADERAARDALAKAQA